MCARITSLCVVFLSVATLSAAPITVPIDLNPGDEYRLVFVSQGGTPGSSASAAFYDNFVTTQAGLSAEINALGTNWSAIVSTPTDNARDWTNTVPGTDGGGIPIYNTGGERIANNYADLWDGNLLGDLSSTATGGVRYDQFGVDGPGVGTDASGSLVWTGTSEFGFPFSGGLGSGGNTGVGQRVQNTFQWTRGQLSTISTPNYRVYAISDVLVAPNITAIPEPSSIAMMLMFCVVGAVVIARKRTGRSERQAG